MVNTLRNIVHLYQPDKLQVRADVPLASAAMVGVGQRAEIVVDVLPNQIFKGTVTRFVHRADLSKNTIEAKVQIHDPSLLLKPDMLARVRILPALASETEQALRRTPRTFAPGEAIIDGKIWIIESQQRIRSRHCSKTESSPPVRVNMKVGLKSSTGFCPVIV